MIAAERGAADAVRIVAVTKTFDASTWSAAAAAGCDAVGENYAQELLGKAAEFPEGAPLPVHFIGHLQSNKVRVLAPIVSLWHTVDRRSVIDALAKERTGSGVAMRVLVQVNATDEGQKSGCAPNAVRGLVDEARSRGLDVRGLMTMGPTSAEPVATRNAFRLVAALARDLGLAEVSMGMTHDARIAVEEGSTMLRIGSGIFGERPRPV